MRNVMNDTWIVHHKSLTYSFQKNQMTQQIISIKVDEDKSLFGSKGSFKLGIVTSHLNPESIDDEARTPEIPWNADSTTIKNALGFLSGIKVKEVQRCDAFENSASLGKF